MTDEEKAKQMMQWALQPDMAMPENKASAEGIPGYEIEKILGQGGMGAVYKARHKELGRVVAIKIFSSTDENADLFVERLKKEGRLMAQLEHPNVLGIHDASVTADGTPYLILEYVEGMDLFVRMQNAESLSEKEAIRVATAVCSGLEAIHGIGIVHRDIKPANILLGNDGSIKVSDFGISKDIEDKAGTQLTLTGTTVGTVDYMSPEHSSGKELDSRADIYSVGVMLYEMIAGVTPRGAFEPLSNFGASKSMEKLVTRCLQRDRNLRLGSAKELGEELGKVRQKLTGKRGSVGKQVAVGVIAGLATVAAGAVVMKAFSNTNSEEKEEIATRESAPGDPNKDSSKRKRESVLPQPSDNNVKKSMWDGSHWNNTEEITKKFANGDNFNIEGGSLISEPEGISTLFSSINPGDKYVVELKWKRYTGDQSIGLLLPTKHGNTIFEMGAWGRELVGLQGYYSDNGRLITMNRLNAETRFMPNQPLQYDLKNAVYHNIRIHVNANKVAILMKSVDQQKYRKVGYYELTGKKWAIPSVWRIPHFKTIGLCSYNSQMYVSNVRFKKLN